MLEIGMAEAAVVASARFTTGRGVAADDWDVLVVDAEESVDVTAPTVLPGPAKLSLVAFLAFESLLPSQAIGADEADDLLLSLTAVLPPALPACVYLSIAFFTDGGRLVVVVVEVEVEDMTDWRRNPPTSLLGC